ncbi:ABC transporter permease [Chryseolinea sp. T2]|uniref:ABC transporter permease n=1 Tax=Chryseolinea sp. T2 TaxID=3129255 RepID=UPI003076926A
MFRNNLRLALRNLWKHKAITLINVVGLTSGLASCMLIVLFIQHEMSFDGFQKNGDRIVRAIMEYSFDGGTETNKGNWTSAKVANVLSSTFPEVERAMRLSSADMIVKKDDTPVTETNFLFADSTFFEMFNYELVQGDAKHALDGPRKLVLTETTAHRYFGNESPIGNTLLLGGNAEPYQITAVIKDYPNNSQISFDMLASFSSLGQNQHKDYWNANYTTYAMLKDAGSMATLQPKLDPFMDKEMKGSGAKIRLSLEAFNWIHLHSPYAGEVPNTSITYLVILGAVAALILMIVCFTYVNLSTARSIERAKEVGVRKVSGAARGQLFWQFIGESFVLVTVSVLVSILVAAILLPYFSSLIEKPLQISGLMKPSFIGVAFGGTVLVSLIAGGYPAAILSGMQPARVLKGIFRNTPGAKWIQQGLVVFQFAITVVLIISTIIIQRQLQYLQERNLGYERDQVVELRIDWDMTLDKAKLLKQQLQSNPDVLSVSRTANSPVKIMSGYTMRKKSAPDDQAISVNANPIDEDFLAVNGLQLVAGTNINDQDMKLASDGEWDDWQYHFIINESAAKRLGWTPEEAIGQEMETQRPGVVRGVVRDFNFQSMHGEIKPLVLFTSSYGGRVLVKLSGRNTSETLDFIGKKWKELLPNRPFEYHFIDDDFNRMYHAEAQLGKAMNIFASIAIALATLGLFGLSSFIVQQRTKEIGIRKVMGASLVHLLTTVSKRFVTLVVLSVAVASPVAYLLMKEWLMGFSYRIGLSWWIFAGAGLLTMIVAIATVSIHGWRAAVVNPVKSLRSE